VGGFDDAGTSVGGHYSYPLTSITAAQDSGLHLYISGPTTVQVNTTNTYYLQFQYGNGSLLSSTASSSLLSNLTATIGSDHLTPSTIGNGEYSVTYEPTAAGEFIVLVTGYFIHSGVNLTTSAFYPVSTISQTSLMFVMPVDTPTTVLENTTTSYVFNVEFPNGTLLNDSQLSTIVSHSTLTLENSAVITPTIQVYDSKIYINFTLPDSGYYTLTWTSTLNQGSTTYNLIYSSTVQATKSPVIDNGMHITVSGAKTIYSGDSYYYYFILSYDNGTYFNSIDTQSAYKNMTLSVYNGATLISDFTPNIQSNGVIFAEISISSAYSSLEIEAKTYLVDGLNLSATTFYNIAVLSPNSNSQISLIPVDTPSNVLTNSPASFVYKLQFANGTYLNDGEISTLLSGLEISIMNTNSLSYTTYVNGGELYLNTTPSANGYYTISISGSALYGTITDSLVYSMTFVSSTTPPIDTGMHIQIIGSPTLAAGTNNSYYLELTYSNGTLFSEANTNMALANLSLTIGSQTITGSYSSPGIITFTVNEPTGTYFLSASTFLNNGVLLKGSSLYPFSADQSTASLTVVPIDTPTTVPLNTSIPYVFRFQFPNGQYLNSTELTALAKNMSVTIENSETLTFTYAISGNELYVYFNITAPGFYTFTTNGVYADGTLIYSYLYSQHIETQPVINNGLKLNIIGTSNAYVDQTYPYYLTLSEENGNSLNSTQTTSALNNLTIEYLVGGKLIKTLTPSVLSSGIIQFNFTPSIVNSDTSLYVDTHIGPDSVTGIFPVIIFNTAQNQVSTSLSGSSLVLIGSHITFTETIFGQGIDHTSMSNYFNNTTLNIYSNGVLITTISPASYTSNNIFFDYTASTLGNYTAIVSLTANKTIQSASVQFQIQNIAVISIGMHMDGTGASPVMIDTANNYTLSLTYGNGTAMNLSDTESIFNNLTVSIYTGTDPAQRVTLLHYYAGVITFSVLFNRSGFFTLYVLGHANFNGFVEGSALIPVAVNVPSPVSNGFHMGITGPSQGYRNTNYNYSITLNYLNGMVFNLANTKEIMDNLTVTIYNGTATYSVSSYSAGLITIQVNFAKQDDYQIYAYSHANIPNNANASAIQSVIILPSTTSRLDVIPIDTPDTALVNSTVSYKFEVSYPNGTLLAPSELSALINASTYSLENSQDIIPTITHSGEYVYINFTLPTTGYYTLTWTSQIDGQKYVLLYSNTVEAMGRIAQGMSIQMAKASAQQNATFDYRVSVLYSNGTQLDHHDTAIVFGVIYLDIYNGPNLLRQYAPSNYTAGQITFVMKVPPVGQYTVQVIVPSVNISTGTVSAAQTSTLTSTRYALNSNSFVDGVSSFFQAIGQNFIITIIVTVGLFALGYFFRAIYLLWRGDKKTAADINNVILSHAVEKMTAKYGAMKEVLPVYASLDYAEQIQFITAKRSVLRDLKTMVGKKQVSMEKIREYVLKIKQKPESDGIFNIFRKQFEENGGMK
jgi:hypothetical protein